MENETEIRKVSLSNIKVNSIGNDCGHQYIVSDIEIGGRSRRITVFLKDKADEHILKDNMSILVEGVLKEDDSEDVLMLNAKII